MVNWIKVQKLKKKALYKHAACHGELSLAIQLLCVRLSELGDVFLKTCDSFHGDQAPGNCASITDLGLWS